MFYEPAIFRFVDSGFLFLGFRVKFNNNSKEKKMKKNLKFFLVLALALVLGLSACNKNAEPEGKVEEAVQKPASTEEKVAKTSEEKKKVERLVIGTTAENNVFSAVSQKDAFGRTNYNNFTQGDFVYVDKNNEIQPFFFTEFTISDDGKELVFKWPEGAIWHDGVPVSEEDILFTFDFMKNVRESGGLKNLESWEITGDHECTLKFSEPDVFYWLNASASNNSCLFAKHIWEKVEDPSTYDGEDAAIGCGPYKLVAVDRDSQTSVYKAVPENNYGGDLMVEEVVLQSYSGEDTLMMAMANGEIDAFFNYANPIDGPIMDTIKSNPDIDPGASDFGGHYQLTYGMKRKPGDDINFRKAVRAGLDYDRLAQVIAGDYGKHPGIGIVTPVNKGFDKSLGILDQDLEEAKNLLDQAGYKDVDGDGFRELPDGSPMDVMITMQYSKKGKETYSRIAEVIGASLKDLGIKTHIDEDSLRNGEVWEANVSEGKYDLSIGYTTSGMTNWSSAFRYFVGAPRFEGEKTWIWGTYDDPEFLETFYKMQVSKTNEEYAGYMNKLQHMAAEDCFAQALCWEEGHFPYRTDKIGGWDNYPGWGVINPRTWYDIYQK